LRLAGHSDVAPENPISESRRDVPVLSLVVAFAEPLVTVQAANAELHFATGQGTGLFDLRGLWGFPFQPDRLVFLVGFICHGFKRIIVRSMLSSTIPNYFYRADD